MATPSGRPSANSSLRVEQLEDRSVPAFPATGGLSVAAGDLYPNLPVNRYEIVTGTGPGVAPLVRVWDTAGAEISSFRPFEDSFRGGINVAVADVTGDGREDVIVTPAVGGGPIVKVFTPDGSPISSFVAINPNFRGGLTVAVGNLDGLKPGADIVVGTGPGGGPVVGVYTFTGQRLRQFLAYDANFRGGVNVAVGDVDTGQPGLEIMTGAGVGGGPVIRQFSRFGDLQHSFLAFDPNERSGVVVAVGDTDILPGAEIYASAGFYQDAFPEVILFNRTGQRAGGARPYVPGFTNSVNMTVKDVENFDGVPDLIVVGANGPVEQVPRIFVGNAGNPAPRNGP
jgi:hypothetical protein